MLQRNKINGWPAMYKDEHFLKDVKTMQEIVKSAWMD